MAQLLCAHNINPSLAICCFNERIKDLPILGPLGDHWVFEMPGPCTLVLFSKYPFGLSPIGLNLELGCGMLRKLILTCLHDPSLLQKLNALKICFAAPLKWFSWASTSSLVWIESPLIWGSISSIYRFLSMAALLPLLSEATMSISPAFSHAFRLLLPSACCLLRVGSDLPAL